MSGNDLGVTVDANVTGYEKGIEAAQKATQKWETSLGQLEADMMALEKSIDDHANAALRRQHDAMDKTGRAAVTFGAVVAAGFALTANEAVKWESAWTGVTKTTSGSAAQMDELEGQLRSLAGILPSTHEEIAAVAEAAGQLGIARQDLAAFTKVAIDLGQTTNMSADDAATSLAQLMNIMRTAPDLVDHLGNTLVALGNHGASTESQIVNMALRVAGAGHLIGLTEADVLGLSSSMANLGVAAELGGGAMSRVLLIIYTAMKDGGDQAAQFAHLAGMSADKFSQKWSNDPVRALDSLFQGMGRVQDGGGNLITTLADLGIKGTQNLQVVLRLAGAGDELTTSLDQSATSWEKNNALLIEAEKRYGTTESQIALARNQLRDSAIDIGNMLLPALASVVGTGADLIRFWQDLPGPVRDVAVVLGLAATAIAIFGGAALIAIPKIAAFNAVVRGLEGGA
ncbi:MAG: Phage tail tape measure protein, partial [Aeromicrobium sp.]|nr:Phage tail tape measure protein [Aeromicrobium sp.]